LEISKDSVANYAEPAADSSYLSLLAHLKNVLLPPATLAGEGTQGILQYKLTLI
jgi:hypothetical protein